MRAQTEQQRRQRQADEDARRGFNSARAAPTHEREHRGGEGAADQDDGQQRPESPPFVEPLRALNTLAVGDDPPLAAAAETDEAGPAELVRAADRGLDGAVASARAAAATPAGPCAASACWVEAGIAPPPPVLPPPPPATARGPARSSRMARGAAHGVHGICRPPAARGRDRLDVLAYAGVPRRGKRPTGGLGRGRNGKNQSQRNRNTPHEQEYVRPRRPLTARDCSRSPPLAGATVNVAPSCRLARTPSAPLRCVRRLYRLPGGWTVPFCVDVGATECVVTGGAAAGGMGQPCVVNAWTSPR